MKTSEILRISQNGYIDSPEEISRLTDTLMRTKMEDLLKLCKEDSGLSTLPLIYDLPCCQIDPLSYLNTAVLISNLDKGPEEVSRNLGGHVEPAQFKRLQTMLFYRALDDASNSNLLVKRFFGINVYSMFECLERRHKDHKLIEKYEALTKTWYNLQGTDDGKKSPKDMNVGTMLKKLDEISNKPWKCWSDDATYTRRIIDANHLTSMILIDSFLEGYREIANMPPEINIPV